MLFGSVYILMVLVGPATSSTYKYYPNCPNGPLLLPASLRAQGCQAQSPMMPFWGLPDRLAARFHFALGGCPPDYECRQTEPDIATPPFICCLQGPDCPFPGEVRLTLSGLPADPEALRCRADMPMPPGMPGGCPPGSVCRPAVTPDLRQPYPIMGRDVCCRPIFVGGF